MGRLIRKIRRNYSDGFLYSKFKKRLSSPFLIKPRKTVHKSGSYSKSHLHKGENYHTLFERLPGRRMVWHKEQEILNSFASQKGPFEFHLDFAGGTGRIAQTMESTVKKQILLDISTEMLSVAAKKLTKAKLINRNFRDGLPEIHDSCLDIATAFRFFSNAEQDLRSDAMAFLAQKIKKGGWLICNNHRNFWSIPYFSKRISFTGGDIGMTNSELIDLAEENNFRVHNTFSIGIIPQSERHALLPWKFVKPIENAIFKISGTRQRLGYNIIFIFEKI